MKARKFGKVETVIWWVLLHLTNMWNDELYEDFKSACLSGVYYY